MLNPPKNQVLEVLWFWLGWRKQKNPTTTEQTKNNPSYRNLLKQICKTEPSTAVCW